MNALIDAAMQRSRTTLSLLLLILIAGTVSYLGIPKEANPDISIPNIYVSLHHEGISPEDAERLLVRPMEIELRSLEGVKEMKSSAYEGGAYVLLEYEAGFDADQALDEVREKVDRARPELPDDTDEPLVSEVNFSLFPVLVVTLSGDVPERTLLRLARDLEESVEGLPNVLEVDLTGNREERVEIVIDPMLLDSYRIDAVELVQRIGRSNQLIAAGSLDTGNGRFAVKVPGLFETLDDVLDMPIKVNGDKVVTVRDIATVRRTFVDRQSYARVDGLPAIGLEIKKRSGRNVIDTIEEVRALVAAESARWPAGVEVTFSQDQSVGIRDMLGDLQNNVISAILLVSIVVLASLGARSAGLVCLAIPGSFLLGILTLSALGLTINIVVLFSLIMAVGMLVDGAIVVTEFADREMRNGAPPRLAYGTAAKRMAWPIIASTATTLAAFMPLLFWPGVVGEFMKFLPITLIATLSASLLMALVFVPTLGAVVGKAPRSAAPTADKALAAGDWRSIGGLSGIYLRVLNRALDHPGKILLTAFAALIAVQVAYAQFGRGVEFFPEVEPDRAQILVHARGNLSIDERAALVGEVEEIVLRRPYFKSVYTSVTTGQRRNDAAEDVIGSIQIEFEHWETRPHASQILDGIIADSAGLAGIVVEPAEEEAGPPVGKPIQVELSARDPAMLESAAVIMRRKLEGMDGVVNIEDSRPIPGIEWRLAVDRAQAAKFGADVSLIGQYVRLVTNGLKLSDYRPDDSREEIDIVVRFPETDRSLDRFESIRLMTDRGLVPLSNFVTRTPQPQTGTLTRIDGRRVVTVKADIAEGVLADDKVRLVRAWLPESGLPPGVSVTFSGEDEEQAESQTFLTNAFGVALFVMAVILVTQFNSFYSAALILSAVIMSTIGVMLGLLAMDAPFGIVMSGVGVIALAGIVVNNNIVLIDTFDRLVRESDDTRTAILRTGAQRLRPVMLTTITTILGLMPMVLQVNIDFITRHVTVGAPSTQWWVQLASAIAFGLTFATVLTLIVTPAALMLRADLRSWRQRRRDRRTAPSAEPPLAEARHGAQHGD